MADNSFHFNIVPDLSQTTQKNYNFFFNLTECAQGKPDVFARVSSVLDWIENVRARKLNATPSGKWEIKPRDQSSHSGSQKTKFKAFEGVISFAFMMQILKMLFL